MMFIYCRYVVSSSTNTSADKKRSKLQGKKLNQAEAVLKHVEASTSQQAKMERIVWFLASLLVSPCKKWDNPRPYCSNSGWKLDLQYNISSCQYQTSQLSNNFDPPLWLKPKQITQNHQPNMLQVHFGSLENHHNQWRNHPRGVHIKITPFSHPMKYWLVNETPFLHVLVHYPQ